MLIHLHINDLAIVDSVELNFSGGLTVLTGETGAGKSIIVDALMLIGGARATADQIRAGAARAEVAATFDIRRMPRPLRDLLDEHGIEADDELLVRRQINSDGRSRAWLNGQSVPVQTLREVVGNLLDVHGQHEFQSLVQNTAQRELLDAYGRHRSLADQVQTAHRVWLALLNKQLELEAKVRDRDARIELLRFQASELHALALRAGEVEELSQEAAKLSQRGRLMEAVSGSLELLYEGEAQSVYGQLARTQSLLKPLQDLDPQLAELLPLLEEASIRVTEVSRGLRHYADSLDVDGSRQAGVERRLAAIEELARKHRTPAAQLPERRDQIDAELAQLETVEQDVQTLRRQQTEALDTYRELAARLSAERSVSARALGKQITASMQTLGMTGGRFQVEVSPHQSTQPQPHGLDHIEFLVTANPGQPLRPLAKVASGGELSRLSLAIQVACTATEERSMVFDEVDSGIGGAVAEIVGRQLRALGERGQVFCVTHLPQVASQGHHHLQVVKRTDKRTTHTDVLELTEDQRVNELARMLGGAQITAKATAHAREMLQAAGGKAR
ncbi:MAG: DNA repair protein RecN [Nevskiaceae bacterium]|jgi:DNA repair protein RecN (Recombination protein N)|nr:DNA repair protein RecN [Nevskiaceae bacterium]